MIICLGIWFGPLIVGLLLIMTGMNRIGSVWQRRKPRIALTTENGAALFALLLMWVLDIFALWDDYEFNPAFILIYGAVGLMLITAGAQQLKHEWHPIGKRRITTAQYVLVLIATLILWLIGSHRNYSETDFLFLYGPTVFTFLLFIAAVTQLIDAWQNARNRATIVIGIGIVLLALSILLLLPWMDSGEGGWQFNALHFYAPPVFGLLLVFLGCIFPIPEGNQEPPGIPMTLTGILVTLLSLFWVHLTFTVLSTID